MVSLYILPRSRPANKPETFGYRSDIEGEMVFAWD